MSDKSEVFQRTTAYQVDPARLTIVGGKGVLPPEEASDCDTEDNGGHALSDLLLLRQPLKPEFVKNVDAYGVLETPVVEKKEGK